MKLIQVKVVVLDKDMTMDESSYFVSEGAGEVVLNLTPNGTNCVYCCIPCKK